MKEAMEKDATQIITAAAATPAPGKMDLAAKIAVVQQKEEEAKQAIADRTAEQASRTSKIDFQVLREYCILKLHTLYSYPLYFKAYIHALGCL